MDPDFKNAESPQNPSQPNPGQTFGPQLSNSPDRPTQSAAQFSAPLDNGSKKSKKIMIVLGGIIVVFAVIAIAVYLTSSVKKSQAPAPASKAGPTKNLYKEPTAVEIENLNNSVSDDITNMSTENDFPSDRLSDKSLRL